MAEENNIPASDGDDITIINEDYTFTATAPDGRVTTMNLIMLIPHPSGNGDQIIVYTPTEREQDEDGNIAVYASIIDTASAAGAQVGDNVNFNLKAITDEADWDLVESYLSQLGEVQTD